MTAFVTRCLSCGSAQDEDALTPDGYCLDCVHVCERCEDYTIDALIMVWRRSGLARRLTEEGWCEDCFDQHAYECESCRCNFDGRAETLWYYGDEQYCSTCFLDEFTSCESCGEFERADNARTCRRCDRILCDSCGLDEYGHDCEADEDSEGIYDYGYKPKPIFHGKGPRYMGVELEIDGAGESGANARQLLEMSNDEELFYIKSDGSLDVGMEIVTHPATLDFHLKHMPWKAVMSAAKDMGYRSHNAGTCGLHVHVSKDAFGETEKARDIAFSKLIVLFWKHWDKLVAFSRRERHQLSWAKQNYSGETVTIDGLKDAKEGCRRYVAVNLGNSNTVEFRIFRGTLNYNTLAATLQLLDVLIDLTHSRGITWFLNSSWLDIVKACEGHKELMAYLVERNLLS